MPVTPDKEKSVGFVVARLSSSRLPAKHLRWIGDRPMLQWIIDRLRTSRELDDIVIATVDEPENRPLQDFAEKNNITCYWYDGHVDHVTTRLRRAAETFEADICVLISGDCPLIDAAAIDQIIRELKNNPHADTVRLCADEYGQAPALQGVVASRIRAWQLADDLADRPELKEHQFPVIYLLPERFDCLDVKLESSLYMHSHRLSVDTMADLAFMNAVHKALERRDLPFDLSHTVDLLKQRPELKTINAHVHQCRLVENKKKVLFVVDAGEKYGYGHLTRSLELARQMTERLAWATHFLVDDPKAEEILQKAGHKTLWGAFARAAGPDGGRPHRSFEWVAAGYDLIVVDIFDGRGPEHDWRSLLPGRTVCVAIENPLPWTYSADMVVMPNLLNKPYPPFPVDQRQHSRALGDRGGPRIIGGENYIILRNDIQRQAWKKPRKTIDALVYLHDGRRRAAVRQSLGRLGLKCKIVDTFDVNFVDHLAHSRIFVSGFGVSFNEALFLETIPICWPDSDAHREDAARFYLNLGLEPLIVDSPESLEQKVASLLDRPFCIPRSIQDGTPNIVKDIADLFDISCSI